MNYVWIVEVFFKGKWWPTIGCGLTKKEAVRKKNGYWKNQGFEKYRVTKYNKPIEPTE